MPIISRFFGIIIRLYYEDHDPPHLHAEYQGKKAVFDFNGNITKGDLFQEQLQNLLESGLIFGSLISKKIGS